MTVIRINSPKSIKIQSPPLSFTFISDRIRVHFHKQWFFLSIPTIICIHTIVYYLLHFNTYFSTILTMYIAVGFGKVADHSMLKYMKAKNAVKSTFALLNRIPAIDVASVKGIVLVSNQLM